MKNPIATMIMNNGNKIKIELYPYEAPNTVNSFIYLANKGAFDNKDIKRLVPGFVIQPVYDEFKENEDYRYEIDGEFRENGFNNRLKLEKGVIAMGGDGKEIASGSCYFITLSDEAGEKLNGKYPGFGRIIEGYEEIERIEKVETKPVDIGIEGVIVNKPVVPETIKSVRVEAFSHNYDKPIIKNIV
ncbi:peptidylprolyl isomerase [Sedimentibacter sp. zth1]|uniref:peptidylprolyl isomerase n=1 Tax=Sedimentibacter sp. zth1 TaxID=2816908 RepID=UPI001F5FA182|nr:peptidylprolyl isomerase [Sedimentibacter sp. zth1]